jgi:hypothetical protein
MEAAVRIGMTVEQRCEFPPIVGVEANAPGRLGNNLLNREDIDVYIR